jgi:hypothetical protein
MQHTIAFPFHPDEHWFEINSSKNQYCAVYWQGLKRQPIPNQAEAMARAQFCQITSSGGTKASVVFSW